jgi:hypothetical protein
VENQISDHPSVIEGICPIPIPIEGKRQFLGYPRN